MGKEDIIKLLGKFKNLGFFYQEVLYSKQQIEGIEKELKSQLPEDYKYFVSAGTTEKANFEFQLPHRFSGDAEYIVFARWNDELFAFKGKEGSAMSEVVYIMEEDTKPEVAFNSFIGYVQALFIAEKTVNNPQ